MKIIMCDHEKNVFITSDMNEIPFDSVDGCPRIGSNLVRKGFDRYDSINYAESCPPVGINN